MLVKIDNDSAEFEHAIELLKDTHNVKTASKAVLLCALNYERYEQSLFEAKIRIDALEAKIEVLESEKYAVQDALSVLRNL